MTLAGITGRSGCGKSTVTAWFRSQGVPALDADQVARQVLLPGSPCLAALAGRFGADILLPDGSPNRHLLADRAFATPEGAKALTDLTHPEILRRVLAWAREQARAGEALCLVDGAVIVGGLLQPHCKPLVVVTAPREASIARICARDGITPEQAARRLDAQLPEEALLAAADFHLPNDGSPADLYAQAGRVLAALRAAAR